jgi:hypothetical protein
MERCQLLTIIPNNKIMNKAGRCSIFPPAYKNINTANTRKNLTFVVIRVNIKRIEKDKTILKIIESNTEPKNHVKLKPLNILPAIR